MSDKPKDSEEIAYKYAYGKHNLTGRELEVEIYNDIESYAKQEVKEACKKQREETNDALRSFYSVIERRGHQTNWVALEKKIKKILIKQDKFMYPDE